MIEIKPGADDERQVFVFYLIFLANFVVKSVL